MNPVEEGPSKPDWKSGRREQLRRWAALPLRDQLLALEEMAELAERLKKAAPLEPSGHSPNRRKSSRPRGS